MSKKEEVFTLPNKVITVKFIPRKISLAPQADKNHIAYGGLLTDATIKFAAPLQKNGAIKNVLTKEEKDHIEELTGLKLSAYSNFWENFYVRLRRDDASNKLDLSNPNDYISYKILKAHEGSEIAPSWADRNKILSYKFAITEAEEITLDSNKRFNLKKEAFKLYARFENNRDTLISILRLLENKNVSDKTSIDRIQEKILEYVDNDPAKFLSVAQDAKFETKALIMEAVSQGVIKRTGNRYVTTDGLELCEAGEVPLFTNAVNYLDANKNQDIRSLIEAKVVKTKK